MPTPERPDPASLHPEIKDFLARSPDLEPLSYRDGEFLVREGAESKEIFILLTGALVVERSGVQPGSPSVVLACLDAGEELAFVGEMAYLGELRRTASVRSSGLSRVLRLEPGHVDRIIEGFPLLTRIICRQFSHRLKETLEALGRFQSRFAMTPARRMAPDGEVLFRAGDPAGDLLQLMAGSLRLEGAGAARTVTPETLPQGFLDLGPYLRGGTRAETATVDGMAFLSVLGPGDRATVVRTFPDLVLDVLDGR